MSSKIVVRIQEQKADLYDGEKVLKTYPISSALHGVGCEDRSLKTPSGHLKISKKIGDGAPVGTVFRGRVPTGEVWSKEPANPLCSSDEDLVLTRILWLEGCEPENFNTQGRYIYFHGTNQESLLGRPASHGCIRMSNRDVLELFDLVDEGTPVYIIPGQPA